METLTRTIKVTAYKDSQGNPLLRRGLQKRLGVPVLRHQALRDARAVLRRVLP